MSAPMIGFAGLTHLGLVSAIARRLQGISSDRLRSPTLRRVARYRSRPAAGGRAGSRRACSRAVAGALSFTAKRRRSCRLRHRLYLDRRCRPMIAGKSDLSGISALIARRDRRACLARVCWSCCARCRRASPAACRCLRSVCSIRSRPWCLAARSSGRRTRSATSSAAPIPPNPLPHAVSRRCLAPSAVRSCPCATRARSLQRSRSTAASSPRSPSPIRWPNSPSASARIGARSRRRCKLDARIGRHAYLAPGLGHRRRQSRARSCHRHTPRCGHGVRGERHCSLRCQQPPPARLGAAGAPSARCSRTSRDATHRHSWPCLQGKHPLDQELALPRADLGARSLGGSSSTTLSFRPRLPPTRAPRAHRARLRPSREPMRSPS